MKLRVVGAVVAVVLAGCGETSDEDASAQAACEHFHNVAGDAELLTRNELRAKLNEVHDTARSADDAEVKGAAREMLASITQDDRARFDAAVRRMSDACDPYRGG